MNVKSCAALSPCDRLLRASGAGTTGSKNRAWTSLTCWRAYLSSDINIFYFLIRFSGCKVRRCQSSNNSHFLQRKGKHSPPLTTKISKPPVYQLRQAASMTVAESLRLSYLCWDIMGFFQMKGCTSSEEQHIFLIKRNWFSDRIYNRISDKPTDLHTHIQMTEAWCIQRREFLLETAKHWDHWLLQSKEPPLSRVYQRRLRVKTDLHSKPFQITLHEVREINNIFK